MQYSRPRRRAGGASACVGHAHAACMAGGAQHHTHRRTGAALHRSLCPPPSLPMRRLTSKRGLKPPERTQKLQRDARSAAPHKGRCRRGVALRPPQTTGHVATPVTRGVPVGAVSRASSRAMARRVDSLIMMAAGAVTRGGRWGGKRLVRRRIKGRRTGQHKTMRRDGRAGEVATVETCRRGEADSCMLVWEVSRSPDFATVVAVRRVDSARGAAVSQRAVSQIATCASPSSCSTCTRSCCCCWRSIGMSTTTGEYYNRPGGVLLAWRSMHLRLIATPPHRPRPPGAPPRTHATVQAHTAGALLGGSFAGAGGQGHGGQRHVAGPDPGRPLCLPDQLPAGACPGVAVGQCTQARGRRGEGQRSLMRQLTPCHGPGPESWQVGSCPPDAHRPAPSHPARRQIPCSPNRSGSSTHGAT